VQIGQLKNSEGTLVQLRPIACQLDDDGLELPGLDDDWRVESVSAQGVRIKNICTDHIATLGLDHIHHYTSNPGRSTGGNTCGFFTLNVQIYIRGKSIGITPTRPGEPPPPNVLRVVDTVVNFQLAFAFRAAFLAAIAQLDMKDPHAVMHGEAERHDAAIVTFRHIVPTPQQSAFESAVATFRQCREALRPAVLQHFARLGGETGKTDEANNAAMKAAIDALLQFAKMR
jgi:hypothetical protein